MTLAAWTLTTLKNAVSGYIELEGDTEALTWLNDIGIGLAELELLKDLDLEIFDVSDTTAVMVNGNPLITKPASIVTLRELGFTPVGGGAYTQLLPRSQSFIRRYWPTEATTSPTPRYFSEETTTAWRVAPTPNAAFPVVARMMKRPTGLKDAPAGTYLGTNFPDALLFGALMQTEIYLQELSGESQFEKNYLTALPKHARERRRERRRDYKPLRPTPVPQKQAEEE